MAVGDEGLTERRFADLRSPVLGVGEEELLLAAESADLRWLGASERGAPRVVGGGDARDVSDVLAEGELPVDVHLGEGPVGVELGGEPRSRLLELREVRRGPPVPQSPLGIEHRSLVVEAVAHLVADDGADRPVVDRRGRERVEEGRLEDGRRKVQAVVERKVHRVDGLRLHAPLAPVHRLSQEGDPPPVVEEAGALDVPRRSPREISSPSSRPSDRGSRR
jgi:hypothetical protein